jgi:hypothetical protein
MRTLQLLGALLALSFAAPAFAGAGYITGSGSTTSSPSTITIEVGADTRAKALPDEATLGDLQLKFSGDPGAISLVLSRDAAGAEQITQVVAPTADLFNSLYGYVCGIRMAHVLTAASDAKGELYLQITTANAVTTTATLTWER